MIQEAVLFYTCITNISRVRLNCSELLIVSKDRFLKLKDFALNMRSTFGSTYMCESTFSTMMQVKSI